MTNLEAARARILELAADPTALKGLQWLVAVNAARDHLEYATVKDTARLFMGGVMAITDYTPESLAGELLEGLEPSDTEEEQQVWIEAVMKEVDEFVNDARAPNSRSTQPA